MAQGQLKNHFLTNKVEYLLLFSYNNIYNMFLTGHGQVLKLFQLRMLSSELLSSLLLQTKHESQC